MKRDQFIAIRTLRTSLTVHTISSDISLFFEEEEGSVIDFTRFLLGGPGPASPPANVSRKESKPRAVSPSPRPETLWHSSETFPLPTVTRSTCPLVPTATRTNRRRTAEINRLAVVAPCTALVLYRPTPSTTQILLPRKRAASGDIDGPPTRKARVGSPDVVGLPLRKPASHALEQPTTRKAESQGPFVGEAGLDSTSSDLPRPHQARRGKHDPSPSPRAFPSLHDFLATPRDKFPLLDFLAVAPFDSEANIFGDIAPSADEVEPFWAFAPDDDEGEQTWAVDTLEHEVDPSSLSPCASDRGRTRWRGC